MNTGVDDDIYRGYLEDAYRASKTYHRWSMQRTTPTAVRLPLEVRELLSLEARRLRQPSVPQLLRRIVFEYVEGLAREAGLDRELLDDPLIGYGPCDYYIGGPDNRGRY